MYTALGHMHKEEYGDQSIFTSIRTGMDYTRNASWSLFTEDKLRATIRLQAWADHTELENKVKDD